jgi:phospholipase C
MNNLKNRLLNGAVVSAAILSLTSYNTAYAAEADGFGGNWGEHNTRSPIKHVVVIIGENRTFDHVFATYQPKKGETVDNLLSKGAIDIDGTPGKNYWKFKQYAAKYPTSGSVIFSISPPKTASYSSSTPPQAPGTSYAPEKPYTSVNDAAWNGPGALATLKLAKEGEPYGLYDADLGVLLTGSTGLPGGSPDSRILNYKTLPAGPYPLVCGSAAPLVNGAPVCKPGESFYDTYGGSPVHRFYQMWQELDCSAKYATRDNPTGCLSDLFPWVEMTVSGGSNGAKPAVPPPSPLLKEGDIAMGFYNVAKGDAPYLTQLANKYVMSDNFHQAAMGGTYANHMMLGYADELYYSDKAGKPITPPANVVENPTPLPGKENWYTEDGNGDAKTGNGGSYSNCSDPSQPGVTSVVNYLHSVNVNPNCQKGAYYLLNNFYPPYSGKGVYDPKADGPFTLPPVKQKHIGQALNEKGVSWAYFGERWKDYVAAPPGFYYNDYGGKWGTAYLYCNICNPFLYSSNTMENPTENAQHNKDLDDFYNSVAKGNLPAVSYVKPTTFADGHPSSSKLSVFEDFSKKVIQQIKANPKLWSETVIFVTFDEGGGYYDSGYVQPVDFFGDGTRIPLIAVSPYSTGGHVSHEYGDHVSIVKFIERNWGLAPLTKRSRDNLPNPVTGHNPYVPVNRPAIGDLWSLFDFSHAQISDN